MLFWLLVVFLSLCVESAAVIWVTTYFAGLLAYNLVEDVGEEEYTAILSHFHIRNRCWINLHNPGYRYNPTSEGSYLDTIFLDSDTWNLCCQVFLDQH